MQGALVQTVALALLHFLWEGLLIGCVAAIALRSGKTAQQRHFICIVALGCCLLAPLITAAVVAHHTPLSPDLPALSAQAPGLQVGPGMTVHLRPGAPGLMYAAVILWLAGALSVSGYYIVQWLRVQRMRGSAFALAGTAAHEALLRSARHVLERWHETARVAVMASHAVLSPIVVGVWRPVIIFPAALLAHMSMDDFELILLHEAAHIVRRDTWANTLQVCLEILLFYHPVVHWLSRRARLERECACDDFAVEASGARYEYARALANLALRPVAPLSLGATGGELLLRLRHLGGEHAEAETFPRSPAHLLVLALLLAVILLMQQPLLPQKVLRAAHVTEILAPSEPLPVPDVWREAPRAPRAAPFSEAQEHRAHSAPTHEVAQRTRAHSTHVVEQSPELPQAPHPASALAAQPPVHPQPAAAGRALPDPNPPAHAVRAPPVTINTSAPPTRAPARVPVLTPVYDPPPEYPLEARMEGVQGSVVVVLRIGAEGRPTGLQILKATPLGVFEGAVHRALMHWRYPVQEGHGREPTVAYRLSFSLTGVSSQPASICATATASRTCNDP